MPAAGDVDIMIAAEMMEAGRAIIRGFVTPDRTTLIASTHRTLAVSEKTVPGNGIASSAEVMATADIASRAFHRRRFDALAVKHGSVISASLFGALAASQALPFPREAFEARSRLAAKVSKARSAHSRRASRRRSASPMWRSLLPRHRPVKFAPAAQSRSWRSGRG